MRFDLHDRKIRVAAALGIVAAAFMVNVGMQAYAQQVKRRAAQKKEETFTRPKPTRPIRPEIPSANRYRQDKVFLEYADSLFKVSTWRDTTERQIVKGNVKFRQAGMWMFCDSAYYYPELNSLDAFGHVRMEQGDTLFVYADKLYYNGNEKMARLKNGPSYEKVRLVNRDVTLTTDSLDYSIAMELGWYEKWGIIDDKVNTLTSLYGEYSPGTKNADFYHEVELVNNKDGYTMLTDTLHYNTATHIARIESETEIQGVNDTILTTRGFYDTQDGNAELLTRSTIIHRDSNNNITTLEGDSIIYDKMTRISRAYMFRDPMKTGMPMVLTDTAHKTTLIGGFGLYNDSTREALATEYPLLMEYSQGDTLFLRADTIKTYILTEMVAASRRWTASGYPEFHGKIVAKADSSSIWLDKDFFALIAPLVDAPLKLLSALLPKKEQPKTQESEKPEIPDKPDPVREMMIADAVQQEELNDDGNLLMNLDSIAAEGTPLPPLPEIKREMGQDAVVGEIKDSIPLVPKEFHVALAYHRARFFKQDLQGVADSMVIVERDSMLYMFRKPIVWSGERQVTGNRIDVHFNDSTADWALLPESGMMSEYIDEDFYNQLAGKKLFATFANQTLKTLEVSGNVETIFLPQESDSTYNRVVNAESSYLTIDLDSGRMDKLKMWPEVTGTVTPIFMVKKQQQYLRQFHWWANLRPVREWYGDRWHWQDDLGEVPDELDLYFKSPSDFGEPKTFGPLMQKAAAKPQSLTPQPAAAPEAPAEPETSGEPEAPVTPESEENRELKEENLPAIESSEEEMQTENAAIEEESSEIEEAVKKEEENPDEIPAEE